MLYICFKDKLKQLMVQNDNYVNKALFDASIAKLVLVCITPCGFYGIIKFINF